MELNMSMRTLLKYMVLATGLAATQAASAVPVVVYSEDFDDGNAANFSGAGTVESVQGYPAPFSGSFLRSDEIGDVLTLSLSGLPSHESIDLNFLLAAIDSWDGSGEFGPDDFNVTVDGVSVFSGSYGFNAPTAPNAGSPIVNGAFGFNATPGFDEEGFDMGTLDAFNDISHSASTLTVAFFASGVGYQGALDESFAIENVQVIANTAGDPPVVDAPEPTTLVLFGLGLLGVGIARSRKVAT